MCLGKCLISYRLNQNMFSEILSYNIEFLNIVKKEMLNEIIYWRQSTTTSRELENVCMYIKCQKFVNIFKCFWRLSEN